MSENQLTQAEIAAALERRKTNAEWYARRGLRENPDGSFTAIVSPPSSESSLTLGFPDLRAHNDIVRRLEKIESHLAPLQNGKQA